MNLFSFQFVSTVRLGFKSLLLHKLQAVYDLPRKLRAAIDRQAYEVAADCYADALPLLKKYGHKVRVWEC